MADFPSAPQPTPLQIQFIFLQAERVLQLAGDVVLGHLHVEGGARVAQVLAGEDGTLLSDEEGGGICVACVVMISFSLLYLCW